jgi:hypothetical protein
MKLPGFDNLSVIPTSGSHLEHSSTDWASAKFEQIKPARRVRNIVCLIHELGKKGFSDSTFSLTHVESNPLLQS